MNPGKQLEKALGMSLDELKASKAVLLPDFIFRHISNSLEGTFLDFHERGAAYSLRGESLVASAVVIGTDPNIITGQASVEGPDIVTLVWNSFLKPPEIIYAHTHPQISKDYLESRGAKRIKSQYLGWMELGEYAYLHQIVSRHFSNIDLKFYGRFQSLYKSYLLASARGYTWIIDPKPSTRGIRLFPNASAEYEKGWADIITRAKAEMDNYVEVNIEKFDVEMFSLLSQYCQRNELLAFANNDYNSRVLERL